jgi:hypothetical protein
VQDLNECHGIFGGQDGSLCYTKGKRGFSFEGGKES